MSEKLRLGWRTVSGAVIAVLGYVSQPEILAVLPEKWAGLITGLGLILAAFGIRVAVARIEAHVDPKQTTPR